MRVLRLHVVAACAAALVVSGCGKEESAPSPAKKAAVEEKVAPYTYPAPVKGHYKEINIGEFDLVDGIAYPATGGVPGAADEVTVRPGTGYVRTEGTNSKGRKFANFYHFAPCGEHLVLVSIAENPQ